jgi:hypothetical protein
MNISVIEELKKFEKQQESALEKKKSEYIKILENKKVSVLENNKKEINEINSKKENLLNDAKKKAKKDSLGAIESFNHKIRTLEESESKVEQASSIIIEQFMNQ